MLRGPKVGVLYIPASAFSGEEHFNASLKELTAYISHHPSTSVNISEG